MIQALNVCKYDALLQVDAGVDSAKKLTSKHVNSYKERILKDFLVGALSAKGKCPHCGCRTRPLRAEYSSKIYFSKGLSNAVAADLVNKRTEQKKSKETLRRIEG